GLKLRGLGRITIEAKLKPWLERLGIAHLSPRSARTLSGGEAQRTSLARALAVEPELLLLDEPFAALDPTTRETLLGDLQRIIRDTGTTTVFVTHDRNEAFALADRVAVLADGHLLQLGSREDIFERPVSAAVAELVGFENRLHGVVEGHDGNRVAISIGNIRLFARGAFKPGAQVVACFRAEAVSLDGNTGETSINRIPGKNLQAATGFGRRRIVVDCGTFYLVAELDRRRGSKLDPRLGDDVVALVDPAAVHVVGDR
ncbi:MAG TPA: ABC transporter ATP-binding protein, partial [Candidatus Limnocylindria bacterium]|nr:ABC transporter ATP-binding protein [Candidatus Limnocylindria bacterium]